MKKSFVKHWIPSDIAKLCITKGSKCSVLMAYSVVEMKLLGLLILLTLSAADVSQGLCPNITKKMVNKAATVGDNVTFLTEACSGTEVMSWFHELNSRETKIWQEIQPEMVLDNRFEVTYAEAPSSVVPEEYKLIIPHVTLEMGGEYAAKLLLSTAMSRAQLVVVEPMSKHGTCPPSGEQKVIGDIVRLSCEVKFNGYLAPRLRWEDSNGVKLTNNNWQVIGRQDSTTGKHSHTQTSRVTATVYVTSEMNNTQFNCRLWFYDEEDLYTEPVYTDSCSTYFSVIDSSKKRVDYNNRYGMQNTQTNPCDSYPCYSGHCINHRLNGYDYVCVCNDYTYGQQCENWVDDYAKQRLVKQLAIAVGVLGLIVLIGLIVLMVMAIRKLCKKKANKHYFENLGTSKNKLETKGYSSGCGDWNCMCSWHFGHNRSPKEKSEETEYLTDAINA